MPPKKKFLVDIYQRVQEPPLPERPKVTPKIRIYRRPIRSISLLLIIAALAIGLVSFYIIRAHAVRAFTAARVIAIYEKMQSAQDAFSHSDLAATRASFAAIDSDIDAIRLEANRYGTLTVVRFVGVAVPSLRIIPETIAALSGLTGGAVRVSELMDDIRSHLITLMVHQKGQELIQKFEALDIQLTLLAGNIAILHEGSASLGQPVDGRILAFQSQLYHDEKLTKAILNWLNAPAAHHLLLLFQNPSTLRPAGGAIGAYGDLAISGGNITSIDVHSTSEVTSSILIVPPEPLQLVSKNWNIRDANWFFDFPLTSRKMISSFNNSDTYKRKNVVFDGTIALNPAVINDILSLTDPTRATLQHELDLGSPKTLAGLTLLMFEKMAALSAADQQVLFATLASRVQKRDLMATVSDADIEEYLTSAQAAGDVAANTSSDLNDYLAVVNANIGTNGSDAEMAQAVTLKSQINSVGEVANVLTVTRTHAVTGAENKDYLQIYTPAGAKAISASGQSKWPHSPTWDYTGYQKDPDVETTRQSKKFLTDLNLEQFSTFGKNGWALWLNTPASTHRTVELHYLTKQKISERKIYTYSFVYEAQSGVDSSLSLHIEAPPGYKWKENNTTSYAYHSDHPDGRVAITLTLVPIQ